MPRKRSRRWKFQYDGGGVALGVAAVVFFVLGMRDFNEYFTLSRLLSVGVEADVKITGMERISSRYSTDVLSYEFTPADSDEPISGEDRFSLSGPRSIPVINYMKLHSPDLRVRYLPNNPAVNRLDIALAHRKSRHGLWCAGMFLLATVLAVAGVWRCRA